MQFSQCYSYLQGQLKAKTKNIGKCSQSSKLENHEQWSTFARGKTFKISHYVQEILVHDLCLVRRGMHKRTRTQPAKQNSS